MKFYCGLGRVQAPFQRHHQGPRSGAELKGSLDTSLPSLQWVVVV